MSPSIAAVKRFVFVLAVMPLSGLGGLAIAQQSGPAAGYAPNGGSASVGFADREAAIPFAPAPTGPLETLEDAWRAALHADQRVEASRWNVGAAESSLDAARAERFPALKLGSDYYVLSDQPTFAATLPPLGTADLPFLNRDSVGFQAMVNQPLYTFGRISNGIDAASEAVKANEAECGRTVLDVKMNVAEIYVVTLRATRIVQVMESKVTSLQAHSRDVAAFYDRGLVSRNDLLAAQVALADAQQQALQSQNSLRVAFAAYNRALGRTLDAPVNLAELGGAGMPGDVNELTGLALQTRPEIAGLAAQMRALDSQAASLRAKNAPQVGLLGGYLYQQNQFVDPNGVAVLAVGVEWTPIDSGRTSHQAEALSQRAQSVLRLRRDAESMIALEVRQRWLELQTARQRVDVTRQATAQADENIRVARDRYQHQVGTNTEVLDAETLRVQTHTNFYNSTYEAVLAELRLRRAIGNL
ncbi:MAG: TolC family protein [Planctomycetaceae bacterium]|nr:TolC family protein [Planctomycetaceae bacterium]